MVRTNSGESIPSNISSPLTPGLTRADSFDSNMASFSPLTPTFSTEYGRQSQNSFASSYKDPTQYEYTQHHDYPAPPMYAPPARPSYEENHQRSYPEPSYADGQMYEEEAYSGSNSSDRGGKRYPCRFRDSHSCSKTFTTSGHASRHSKIHTAEKGVHCTYEGCPKKFTRADNMKQHLETHNKDKSSRSKMVNTLTRPAGVRKAPGVNQSQSRPSSRNSAFADLPALDPALVNSHVYQNQFQSYQQASPNTAYGAPHTHHSPRVTSPYQGLDVLAAAADFTTQS